MAKYVVTGGAGFIGHHVVNTLIERGDEVVVIDNLAGGNEFFGVRKNDKAVYYHFDISETSALVKNRLAYALENADYVINLAALPRVQASIDDPVTTCQVNVMGTIMMLEAARKANVKRFVHASSSSVYGDSDQLPLHESMTPNPMSPYARHKFIDEQLCQDYALAPFNLPTVCLRFFNVYGPGADPNGAYALVVAKFLDYKRQGKKLPITGTGDQTRDFTHIQDVVRGILLAVESQEVGMGEVINLGGGRQISVNEVADLIDPEHDHEYIEARFEPHDTLASIEKAKRWLGWEPQITFEDGIAELLSLNHP
ncbi:MAG TPA: NAD-dependent epimerase/dehydratase family protein [Candidatus Paceibacterota bacterium]|nr:NAD-dependent epimerase/dehydratase family protein [Candidatus Paceibacterota bacterium]